MLARLTSSAAALSVAGLVLVGVSAPAFGQESQPGNPGQGSERCAAAGAPGQSPQYPPAQSEPRVSDRSPQRGQQVSATSGCREFAPGQRVAFGVESVFQQLGSVLATVDGEAIATFTVPTNLRDGQHHVVFRGTGLTGAPNEVRIPIVVSGGPATGGALPDAAAPDAAAPDAAAPGGGTVNVGGVQLPRTGSNEIVPLTALGIGLLTAGAAMVVVARRRRDELSPSPLA